MASSTQIATRTYLFGSFAKHQDPERYTTSFRINMPRLAVVVGVVLLAGYGLAVSAGYLWLHDVRKVERITFWQVALFRGKKIRRDVAVQQMVSAKAALAAKNYREAYVSVTSALRNDPDNVDARLTAAGFLEASGSMDRAIGLLEEGLQRTPGNRTLVQQTFDLLDSSAHYHNALDFLHGPMASQFSGPNGSLLLTFEIAATLGADGPAAAHHLLDQHPELRTTAESCSVVARVLWESGERRQAIDLISAHVKDHPDDFSAYVQLADYQQAAGLAEDACRTAEQTCMRFPDLPAPRILLIGTLSPSQAGAAQRWQQEVTLFLEKFGSKPEAVAMLADLAGRKGWVDLARVLYEVGISRQQDARMLALYYSDALVVNRQFEEARQLLAEIDRQTQNNPELSLLIWPRQVVAAAGGGAHEDARETARRLATTLQRDPDRVEFYRRRFVQLGIPEAVAELTAPSSPAAKISTPKKS